MEIKRILAIDQLSEEMENIAIKNGTTVSTCGYITLAICEFLTEEVQVTENTFKMANLATLAPYIQKVMVSITGFRRLELKKYMTKMNDTQKKDYLKDWVANYEIVDYLAFINDKMINQQVFFFRQVAHDHPKALQNIKWEEAERIKEEEQFKGEKYFYTSFNPVKNHKKEEFVEEIQKCDPKLPIIIATDVLGHFNTTILFGGKVFVLDSLVAAIEGGYDGGIQEAIKYYYQKSYLKE